MMTCFNYALLFKNFLMSLNSASTMTLRAKTHREGIQKAAPPHVGFTSPPKHQATGQKTANGKKEPQCFWSKTVREEVAVGSVTHPDTLNVQLGSRVCLGVTPP